MLTVTISQALSNEFFVARIVEQQSCVDHACKDTFQWFSANLSSVPIIWIVVVMEAGNTLLNYTSIDDIVVLIDANPDMDDTAITGGKRYGAMALRCR